MPRVNIYIRQDDWDKWQAIESKPEWLHERLQIGNIIYGSPNYPSIDSELGTIII